MSRLETARHPWIYVQRLSDFQRSELIAMQRQSGCVIDSDPCNMALLDFALDTRDGYDSFHENPPEYGVPLVVGINLETARQVPPR